LSTANSNQNHPPIEGGFVGASRTEGWLDKWINGDSDVSWKPLRTRLSWQHIDEGRESTESYACTGRNRQRSDTLL